MNTTSTICGKCHRPLTDPKSVERGFGPDCWASIKAEEALEEKVDHSGAQRSDYDYHIAANGDRRTLVIEDLDKGGMSVTNNIDAILGHICEVEGLDPQGIDIIYRDSDGIYDGVYADKAGAAHIYALSRLSRPRSEGEALEALRQQQAAGNDTPNH